MSEYVNTIELLRWERRVANVTAAALREYLAEAQTAALPSLTADLGPIPPDPGALAATAGVWRRLLREKVLPTVEGLMAERVLDQAPEASSRAGRVGRWVQGLFGRVTGRTAKAYAIPSVREWMETYMAGVENRMVRTPDMVFDKVRSTLNEGHDKGEGVADLRERVQSTLDYTGHEDWPGRAELVARTECLPPDAPINGANVTAVYRRPYSGPWVVVQTQAGHTVSGTPNHPVLTERGWVGLGDLRESDHLVRDLANVERTGASGDEHVDGGPATIGEIFDAVKAVAVPVRMRTGQPDFHGDGGHGDVEVLRPDRVLRLGSFASLDERVKQFGLEPADSGDATLGAGFRRTLPVDQGLSLFSGAEWDALVAETANDDVAVASVVGGEPVDRLASKVTGSNVGSGNVVAGAGVLAPSDAGGVVLGGSPDVPAEAADDTGHRGAVDAVVGGERGGSLPGLISLDKVLSVEVTQYAGHVYNVTCEEGYFAGVGGIVTSNTTGAYNAATLQSARLEAEALGIEYQKVWIATIDARTRDSHFAADGQRRPLDGTFTVGGSPLRYPGDESGAVEEVANCRCTMAILEPDEPLPSEDDRHTERGETNATVRNRAGSQRDEIDRRAADGVVRARDDDDGDGSIRASMMGDTMSRTWTGRLAPIGEPSGDGRIFKPGGEYGFRTFPLPLMYQRSSSEGHDSSVIIGAIRSGEVQEDGIYGTGVLFDSPEATEASQLLEEGVLRPSIDWCDQEWELVDQDGNVVDPETLIDPEQVDQVLFQITASNLMGATLVAKPAFDGTYVRLNDQDAPVDDGDTPAGDEPVDDDTEGEAAVTVEDVQAALTAGGGLAPVFDRAMFDNPNLQEVTGIHVTDEGRVVGHVATWNQCHVGIQNACVMAPRSKTGYALFHVSEVDTTDGPLAVGRLTVGAGHADPKLGVIPAREHYDNAGACWAIGRVYEDDHGIAFSGVVHPHATPRQIMDGTSAPLSGDWRRHGGNLELVAALTVNTPGYPVVRGASDDRGRDVSLVAAGVLPATTPGKERPLTEIVAEAARAAVEEYTDRMKRVERTASIHERIAAENRAKADRIASRRLEVGVGS